MTHGGGGDTSEPLSDPAVPADLYSEYYYRNWNAGYPEWQASEGTQVAGIYPGVLQISKFRPGEVLVDIGTGRGELIAVAVESGAAKAIGIEYSPDGVKLAHQTLAARGTDERGEVILADARAIPVDDGTADLVTMVDVVEHLTDEELARALLEAKRLLKPGGRIFIHTFPNRTIYDWTYRVQRMLTKARRAAWPPDPRIYEYERLMHVNEQTYRSLRGYLRRAGYAGVNVWHGPFIYTHFVPDGRAKRLYARLARFKLTRAFGSAELFAIAFKPG